MIKIFNSKNKPFSLVKDGGYNKKHPFYELARAIDDYGFISKTLARELENLFEEEYTVGIHRTGHSKIGLKTLNDFFNNGLENNGDRNQGVVSDPGIIYSDDTITFFKDFIRMLHQIKAANGYKNSDGVMIVKIPSAYVSKTEESAKPIYFIDGNVPRLLPEYIYGYVPVDENGVCGDIIRNPKYTNDHTYQNDGLYYDSDTGMSNNINM